MLIKLLSVYRKKPDEKGYFLHYGGVNSAQLFQSFEKLKESNHMPD